MRIASLTTCVFGISMAASGTVRAQGDRAAGGEAMAMSGSADVRSYASNSLVLPEGGFQLGGELTFLTSTERASGEDLRFTDVVLVRPRARYSFGGIETFAGVDVLAKQPSTNDDAVFLGGHLGGRLAVGKTHAMWLRASGGPLRAELGAWASADAGAEWRKFIARYAAFQLAAGATANRLFVDEGEESMFAEVAVSGQTVFMVPTGEAGAWVGTEFYFPIAERGPFAPHTRVNVRLGVVLSAIESWDLYAEIVAIDRGDVEDPATMLPILDGGFDQTQLVMGIIRRFRMPESSRVQMAY